jgi:hypothetical protein
MGRPDGHAEQWKLSRAERNKLVYLERFHGELESTNVLEWVEDQLVDKVPRDHVVSACETRYSEEAVAHAKTWTPPAFPVTGEVLASVRGIQPGPVLGAELRKLRQVWRASRYTATAEALLRG